MAPDHLEPPDDRTPAATGGSVGGISSLLPATTTQWATLCAARFVLGGALATLVVALREGSPGEGSVDVGFLQDMSSHHAQAIRLSNLALTGDVGEEVAVFAREILYFQGYEIGLMEGRLQDWGHRREDRPELAMTWMGMSTPVQTMPGMASDDDLALLDGRTGPEAAALFVELLRAHHVGGVHMASYAAEHASDRFVRDLAERMAHNQAIEIQELDAAARRAGLPDPAVSPPAPAAGDGPDHTAHD